MEEDSYDLTVEGDITIRRSSLVYASYEYNLCNGQSNTEVDVDVAPHVSK